MVLSCYLTCSLEISNIAIENINFLETVRSYCMALVINLTILLELLFMHLLESCENIVILISQHKHVFTSWRDAYAKKSCKYMIYINISIHSSYIDFCNSEY